MQAQAKKHRRLGAAAAAAAAATAPDTAPEIEPLNPPASRDEIALLAYTCWQARGCPDGSPEEDWFRAQEELGVRGKGVAK